MKIEIKPNMILGVTVVLTAVLVTATYFLASPPQAPASVPASEFYTEIQRPEAYVAQNLEEVLVEVDLGDAEFEAIFAEYVYPELTFEEEVPEEEVAVVAPKVIKKVAPDYAPVKVTGSPRIAIIIDDMGVDRTRSFRTIELDAPLTLSFLPYADGLADITKKAKAEGHELMIHMPMQATTNPVSLGPIALKSGMDEAAVKANMQAAFDSFDGYVGLNNHMGSRVTQDSEIMGWAMESLKSRGLYFVDSRTIGSSVAAEVSRENGLPTGVRDIFLDHEATPEFVMGALRKLEAAAVRNGYAIAIGHPKDVTIAGLKAWLPDAQARGFEIVYASALVAKPVGAAKSANVKEAALHVKKAPEKIKWRSLPKTLNTDVFDVEPAAGDPNSLQSRQAILKSLLGQAEDAAKAVD